MQKSRKGEEAVDKEMEITRGFEFSVVGVGFCTRRRHGT